MINHDTMKEQIVDAAREVFAKYGYRKTTMDDIAAAVYKAKSSIYHYFSGKEEIFKAVIDKEADTVFHETRDAIQKEADPIGKFTILFKTFYKKVNEAVNYFQLLRDEWYDVFEFTRYSKEEKDQIAVGMIASVLFEGNATGIFSVDRVEEKAKAISIAFWGFVEPWRRGSFEVGPASLDAFLDIMLNGIKKR